MSEDNSGYITDGPWSGHCLFASFDILGYSSMIEACTQDSDTKEKGAFVFQTMEETEGIVGRFFRALADEVKCESKVVEPFDQILKLKSNVKSYCVSDTVVLMMTLPREEDIRKAQGEIFFVSCCLFAFFMFIRGLPVRGAIDYGFCYTNGGMSFGRPVVRSHRLSESLQFVGVVITPEAKTIYEDCVNSHLLPGLFEIIGKINKKEVPTEELLLCLDWLHVLEYIKSRMPPEKDGVDERVIFANSFKNQPELVVDEVFRKHGKTVDEKTKAKISNTVKIFREMENKRKARWMKSNISSD